MCVSVRRGKKHDQRKEGQTNGQGNSGSRIGLLYKNSCKTVPDQLQYFNVMKKSSGL